MTTIDYYIFPQSPYAYMGHARFAAIASKAGAQVRVLPMDAAKVFPATGGLPLAKRAPARISYRMDEMRRWKAHLQLPMHLEPAFFPVAGDAAARMIIASGDAAMALSGAIFKAVWEQQRNIADEAELVAIATSVGLDGAALLSASKAEAIQAQYDTQSQQAIDVGIFGAPTFVINGERFWGQDRLDFVERALQV
jgi:2-hydroxychromene-2-carboxylate isomerase